jgi:hypothetical protein
MQIQVNTDDNVSGRTELALSVEAQINDTLDRFRDRITRIEVHLSDENSGKAGENDKRCLMEARLAGRKPIAVTNSAGSLDEAFSGAAEKMKRALESALGRIKDSKGRDSIRGDESTHDGSLASETAAPQREDV